MIDETTYILIKVGGGWGRYTYGVLHTLLVDDLRLAGLAGVGADFPVESEEKRYLTGSISQNMIKH